MILVRFVLVLLLVLASCNGSTPATPPGGADSGADAGADRTPALDMLSPQDGPAAGCTSAAQCDDSIACTEDLCSDGVCRHNAVPMRCGAGQTCDVRRGCQMGRVCGGDAECADTDPCTMGERCDMASRVCVNEVLDGDRDNHPPRVCGGDDCDDGNAEVYPGAAERCNNRDDNCNMMVDETPAATSCGGSGFICSSGMCTCSGRVCRTDCVDLQTDRNNCGECGRSCGTAGMCVAGACRCAAGMTDCGPTLGCIDTTSNSMHCGRCGNVCGAVTTCSMGACRCMPGMSPCVGGVQVFASSERDRGNALAVDAMGNVALTGFVGDMTNFVGGPLLGRFQSIFAASVNTSGAHRWSRVFEGDSGSRRGSGSLPYASMSTGYGIAADASGNVYLVGSVRGGIGFGDMYRNRCMSAVLP